MDVRRGLTLAALVATSIVTVVPRAHADAPSNDDRANATAITSLAFDADVDLSEATVEAGEPDCYWWSGKPATVETAAPGSAAALADPRSFGLKTSHGSPGITTNSVWYRYSPAADGRIAIDTLGSGPEQDTVLAVYVESPRWGLSEVGCNDDVDGGLRSRVVVDAYAGETLLIQLGAFQGRANAAHLHVDVAPPRGIISGLLTDDDTGEPIDDVCVSVIGDASWGWTFSGPDGRYSVAVDPDTVRLHFYTCRLGPDGETAHYQGELYDDVQDWEQATVLTVEAGVEIPNIDAGLTATEWEPYRDVDFAVTDMRIDHPTVQVDGLAAPVGPGVQRVVEVDVANLGPDWGQGMASLVVCPMNSLQSCHDLGQMEVYLDAGETQRLTFNVNDIGTVGDVVVRAQVHSCGWDLDDDNNVMERRDYVVIGGLGYGASLRAASSWYPCE